MGEGMTNLCFKWISFMIPLKIFKNKYPSLLIRFIMTTGGKHKTSCIDFSRCLFNFVFDSGYLGGGGE